MSPTTRPAHRASSTARDRGAGGGGDCRCPGLLTLVDGPPGMQLAGFVQALAQSRDVGPGRLELRSVCPGGQDCPTARRPAGTDLA